MKKITLSLLFGLISFLGFSQIGLVENFDSGFTLPAGWTSPGNIYAVSFNQNCDGRSIRAILDDTTLNAQITSPNVFGQSNGTDLTISFDYKIVDWSEALTATPAGWGEMFVQYSTDDGITWVTIETINDTNHVTSNTCVNWSIVVPSASLPVGSDFKLRVDTNRVAQAYYVYLDNISATQVVANPPSCVNLITPANGSIGVSINTDLEWSNATGIPTGYLLNVGTSSGGVDIVDGENTGLSTTYDLPVLEYATTYYVNVTPFNASGEATGCSEFSFTTGADPDGPVNCASGAPINTVYCYESLDTTFFSFTSSDGSPLFLQFNAGEIEVGDDGITIYDGTNTSGPVLFTGDNGGDFTGLSVTATSGDIYITIQSDGFTSCQSGMVLWDFDVFCVDTTALPNCDAVLNNPNNGDINVDPDTNINWLPASILVTGYEISVGSTPGATDIANSIDVGNVTSWNPPATLAFLTTYYVTIRPYNNNGFAENCNEQIFTTSDDPNAPIDCDSGAPRNTVFCYENNDTTEFTFVSSSGAPLFVIFHSGETENNYDALVVTDSDGSNIYSGYGTSGNLAGLTFTSSGDTITVGVTSDNSVIGCGGNPWNFSVFCVDTTIPPNCDAALATPANGEIGVEIDTVISWTQASIFVTGYVLSVGTTPGGTDVIDNVDVGNVLTYTPAADLNYETTYYVSITPYNTNGNATAGCVEESFTTKNDPNQFIDCSTDQVVNTVFCYENNDTSEFSFTSLDGSQIVIVFNSGTTENNWDELVVTDSDGTILYNGYGNNGDLTGLVFVSSGDNITVGVTSDGIFVNCTNDPWDFDALCLDTTAVPNCDSVLTAPVDGAFDVELNTDISWTPASIFVTGYNVTIGSTPGGNDIADNVDVGDTTTYTPTAVLDYETTYYVSIVPYNANGPATDGCIEESFITKPDPNTIIICDECPLVRNYCYENNDTNVFMFTSQTGGPVVITFNSGQVENNWDELIVLDSDGVTNLNAATPYGNGGDISGLQFTSTGSSLSIQVQSDGSGSCSSGSQESMEYTVRCQSYIVQEATYTIVPDCENGEFYVDVDVTNLGSSGSVTVTDNQGSPSQEATTQGVLTFGPYPDGGVIEAVIFTAPTSNLTCTVSSEPFSFVCPLPVVQCPIINAGDDLSITCADTVELSAAFMAFGQDTSSYQINALDCPTPPASGGTPTSLFIDDSWTDPINLSFEFCYFGEVYDRVQIGANGALRFEIDVIDVGPGTNAWNLNEGEGLPNNTNPTLAEGNIFGVCHDIDPSVCGDINYTIAGTAPARQFIINFTDICHFGFQCNSLTSSTQIILYESSNAIDINVFEKPVCLDWNGGLAVTGIQNNAGDIAYVPPGRNTGVWAANNEFWRFTPSQGDPNYSFEWFDGTTSLGNEEVITVSPTETTTYTAAITYELCSGGTATITDDIVVEFLGDQADDATIAMDATCDGGTATITGTLGGVFTFNPVPGDSAQIDPATGLVTDGVAGTTYTVEYTTTGACPDTSTADVTVLITDDATFTMLDTCDGGTVDTVTTPGGTFAFQSPAPTDGAVINASTGAVTGGTAGVTYTIEYTTSGVCPATSMQSVTVLPSEDASFTMTAACDGATATIDGDTGGTFAFDPLPTDTAVIDDTTGIVTGLPGTTYTVTYTTSGVCPETTTETVTVLPEEDASFTVIASCTGGTVTIDGDTGGTFAFNPAPSDGAVINGMTGEVTNGTTGETYSIEYTTAGVCPMSNIESLTLLTDVFDFTVNGDCNGAIYELTIDPINNGYDANTVTYALYDDMNTLLQTNTVGDNVFVIDESIFTAPMSGSTYNYIVEVSDNSGCVETNEVLVESINCVISQGISPNNDDKNDSFDLRGFEVSRLEIFNRHGVKVYSKTNYTNEWHGQSDAGDELPVGTYFYLMEYQGNKTKTSWIYLNREN
ncbi:gliding motility-associated C-terminal domain-containing protein [Lacinutrix himadriensis]|uniref:T9SS type B sorting domain-containing protein n=1 Tax=Lacinutrix himadriensis TaxID=641549 RepID=UPI0006E341D0|nr:gliding motility-associated C-terminal domain-containing protein [Lacinutrix himadriensis]